jgi:predicted O-methyltransferase YrrM
MTRFHEQLYQLVLQEKPAVMVETGYATGLSAMHILAAMDINGRGNLYSVECFTNQDITHPRLTYLRGMSQEVLPALWASTRCEEWDIFLHDSDHGAACQDFEYRFAWDCLRPGGVLISDDIEWTGDDGKPHYTWKKFLESHEHTYRGIIGCAQWVRKPV